jgi:hypothetical protein
MSLIRNKCPKCKRFVSKNNKSMEENGYCDDCLIKRVIEIMKDDAETSGKINNLKTK